jgi:hypothetical protein
MKREIKFRAWDRKTQKMITNSASADSKTLIGINGELYTCWQKEPLKNVEHIDGTPELIIMQYTGLKDKNGVEIYEGDILSGKRKRVNGKVLDTPSTVFYMKSHAMFQIKWDSWNQLYNQPFINNEPLWKGACSLTKTNIEVIGNIHENK